MWGSKGVKDAHEVKFEGINRSWCRKATEDYRDTEGREHRVM